MAEGAFSRTRRFKLATGLALIDYVQNLRIEEAKRLLESSDRAVDDICYETGYEDASFFRRLFRRRTGVAPAQYRRVFKPILAAAANSRQLRHNPSHEQ